MFDNLIAVLHLQFRVRPIISPGSDASADVETMGTSSQMSCSLGNGGP